MQIDQKFAAETAHGWSTDTSKTNLWIAIYMSVNIHFGTDGFNLLCNMRYEFFIAALCLVCLWVIETVKKNIKGIKLRLLHKYCACNKSARWKLRQFSAILETLSALNFVFIHPRSVISIRRMRSQIRGRLYLGTNFVDVIRESWHLKSYNGISSRFPSPVLKFQIS